MENNQDIERAKMLNQAVEDRGRISRLRKNPDFGWYQEKVLARVSAHQAKVLDGRHDDAAKLLRDREVYQALRDIQTLLDDDLAAITSILSEHDN